VRFRPELRVIGLVLLLAVAAPALPDAKPVTQAEIDHAIDAVKKDPNLANKQTVRTLRWDATPEKEKKKKEEATATKPTTRDSKEHHESD